MLSRKVLNVDLIEMMKKRCISCNGSKGLLVNPCSLSFLIRLRAVLILAKLALSLQEVPLKWLMRSNLLSFFERGS